LFSNFRFLILERVYAKFKIDSLKNAELLGTAVQLTEQAATKAK